MSTIQQLMNIMNHSFTYDFVCRSEILWKDLGKEGLAVKAPWPIAGDEDKLLTKQAKFLRDSLKNFRASAGKAKKGWKSATILVAEDYPQWKVDALLWMQSQYNNGFSAAFMADLKDWSTTSVADKKQVKSVMQFVSFMKREVEDVGEMGMDIKCPFDQLAILKESKSYIQSQLGLAEVDVRSVDDSELDVPDKTSQNVTPGKPFLWMR